MIQRMLIQNIFPKILKLRKRTKHIIPPRPLRNFQHPVLRTVCPPSSDTLTKSSVEGEDLITRTGRGIDLERSIRPFPIDA